MSHEIENVNKKEITKRIQMEIMELKCTTMKMKHFTEGPYCRFE